MQNWIKEFELKNLISWVAIAVIAVVAAFLIELLYFNYHPLFDKTEKLEFKVEDNKNPESSLADISILDGERENEKIVLKFKKPSYYRKLNITFDNKKAQRYKLTWIGKDSYGQTKENTYKDLKKGGYKKGVTNIEDEISELTIELYGSGKSNITSVKISNSVQLNRYRLVLLFTSCFIFLFMILKRKWFKDKLHLVFFILALMLSLNFWFLEDMMQSGWDENVHFTQSYVAALGENAPYTKAIQELEDLPEEIWANTYEEHRMLVGHFNRAHEKVVEGDTGRSTRYKDILYLPYIISIKMLSLIGCSFFQIYFLSKLSSMICYILIMAYAIKIAKTGKLFLTATGIMPTRLFINSTYNYDSLTVAFLTLGFVLWLNELLEPERKLTLKKAIAIVLCFLLGSIVKQVYIGFVLLILVLPKEKYKNARQKKQICCIFVAVGCAIVGIMAGPILVNYVQGVNMIGDLRGGDTNMGAQIALILKSPFAYLKIMLGEIWKYVGEYLLGRFPYVNFSFHRRPETKFCYITTIVMLSLFCLNIEDTVQGKREMIVDKRSKAWIGITIGFIVSLIWSALYISYTPVGAETIKGVQARYYAPLIFPLMCVIKNNALVLKCKEEKYNMTMLGVIVMLNIYCIYTVCMVPWTI